MVEEFNNIDKAKAVIYARVSTGEQETENQINVLMKWAESKGFKVTKVYQENESAWKSGHQAAFADLLADALHYRFDYVLVWALDRVSREGPLAVLKIIDYQQNTIKAKSKEIKSLKRDIVDMQIVLDQLHDKLDENGVMTEEYNATVSKNSELIKFFKAVSKKLEELDN